MTDGSFDMGSPGSPRSPDWEALARHMVGEASPEESARIDDMLAGNPADQQLLDIVDGITSEIRSGIPAGLDIEAALAKVKAHPEFSGILPLQPDRRAQPATARRSRWRIPMPALAAAALLAVGVASWMAYANRPREQAAIASPRMLATGVGVRDSMVLSDGTRVVIGPLSAVKVAADYGSFSRDVSVRGDAWFEVAHNASKPFTVHAGTAAITDVGTRFAVRSDDPAGVSVSVLEGAVSLRQVNSPPQQGVILKAGDNGLLKTSGQVVPRRGAATADDFAWLHGKLVFREAPIGEVVSSMHKWYGIELKVADQSLVNRHLTATFAGESADRALEVIRLALGADIERHGDTAVTRSTKGSMRAR